MFIVVSIYSPWITTLKPVMTDCYWLDLVVYYWLDPAMAVCYCLNPALAALG